MPASVGSSVTKYEITARGKDKKYYPVTQCNGSNNGLVLSTSCTIPMSVWEAKPFLLDLGEDLYVVGRAYN